MDDLLANLAAAEHRRRYFDIFDNLPQKLRDFINNWDYSLHDDHVLKGEHEVRRVQYLVMRQPNMIPDPKDSNYGQN